MNKEFWLERWHRDEIGFHDSEVNIYLKEFWQALNMSPGDKVFVPLCGKSVDMQWLRTQGHPVLGVEFSEVAAKAFFQTFSYPLNHTVIPHFECYAANDIQILCGDFFDLRLEDLADIKVVYDRASMVALPREMRLAFASHLLNILPAAAKIILVAIDYPQSEMQGPPFALSVEEVEALYGEHAEIRLLGKFDALPSSPRFKKRGLSSMFENVYLLTVRKHAKNPSLVV